MDNFTAVGIAEGFEPAEFEAQIVEAWTPDPSPYPWHTNC
jgi:hypothetical protein